MHKMPFEYLDREVEKLYEKPLDGLLEDHILFIVSFIHACGWTEEEYHDAKYRVNEKYLNPRLN